MWSLFPCSMLCSTLGSAAAHTSPTEEVSLDYALYAVRYHHEGIPGSQVHIVVSAYYRLCVDCVTPNSSSPRISLGSLVSNLCAFLVGTAAWVLS
ncbi:uncharacterized protein K460DRAFT_206387 [Cucurbitaria berberidis CBS 394.84]|uniref:Uncharacterized protein n=1 Tax=Cucurbitaria berberidis CBS 394.84 TaxID=1168544 RepID=A0A9P4L3H2_9PLEO|nr:uncharacterized protein K460DRAFT_206387 [Cucurbitaria berberidis CBS 394.84]KAF1840307.1 hypothetical protein K460DRAFT_206387 [Cucurbitaria berberidis CBS 394.84]